MGERAVDGAFAAIITIFLLHSQDHLEITNILLASSFFCLQSSVTISEEKRSSGSGIISHFTPLREFHSKNVLGMKNAYSWQNGLYCVLLHSVA